MTGQAWVDELWQLLEGSMTSAAQESAGFLHDTLGALMTVAWIAAVVALAVWLGRSTRAFRRPS
ncbi:MAG: hypothetical protein QM692_11850 [Thermomicrobiales bacterium]